MRSRSLQTGKNMDCKMLYSSNAPLDCPDANFNKQILSIVRSVGVLLAAAACLIFAMPAQSAVVFSHSCTPLSNANTLSSNAVADPDGSDRDVTAYDNFTLIKPASITSVTWRGSSSTDGLAGFTIKIYASNPNPAAQADMSSPLAEINVVGKAAEKPAGKNLSDYRADFSQPLALTAGVQYWISIVSIRNDPSSWGWANGTGGDGRTIQSYAEFKILPAPNDRAFSLDDGL